VIDRRRFLRNTAVAGAATALGFGRDVLAAEPPLETTRLRLSKNRSICTAPQFVAHELLVAEGFKDIEYFGDAVTAAGLPGARSMAAGQIDVGMNFAGPLVLALDMNLPISLIGGIHAGCFELFATERVRSIGDLRGKTVGIPGRDTIPHVFLSAIATSVGIDPEKDIQWSIQSESKKLLAEGRIDAFLAFPPDTQELRAKHIGKVVFSSLADRPWSQYFCCLVSANKDFMRKHPVATKRALRAILKAGDLCASDPERAVSAYAKLAYPVNTVYARQAISELPYGKWREFNAEETVRFYALRLREAGMVKGAPQKLIAQGTDWRFLNELKKELKA